MNTHYLISTLNITKENPFVILFMKINFQDFTPINIYMNITKEEIENQLSEYYSQLNKSNQHIKYKTTFSADSAVFEILKEINQLEEETTEVKK